MPCICHLIIYAIMERHYPVSALLDFKTFYSLPFHTTIFRKLYHTILKVRVTGTFQAVLSLQDSLHGAIVKYSKNYPTTCASIFFIRGMKALIQQFWKWQLKHLSHPMTHNKNPNNLSKRPFTSSEDSIEPRKSSFKVILIESPISNHFCSWSHSMGMPVKKSLYCLIRFNRVCTVLCTVVHYCYKCHYTPTLTTSSKDVYWCNYVLTVLIDFWILHRIFQMTVAVRGNSQLLPLHCTNYCRHLSLYLHFWHVSLCLKNTETENRW